MKSPEFPRDLHWFNSKPLRMSDLSGRVVLIDFWTYSCVNCLRTLPHLKRWHELYAEKGLVIIGVHTPEFEFEKSPTNVSRALSEFGIKYPVVLDSDYLIWSLYSNSVWPRKFLINKDGRIVYDHAGEGGYGETEKEIQKALLEINSRMKLPAVAEAEGSGGVCLPTTPETYLGSLRGRAGKVWNFEGNWRVFPEFIEHQMKTKEFKDFILLNFEAAEVNLVLGTKDDQPAEIKVEVDGQEAGNIKVNSYKMFNLFKANELRRGQIKIYSNSDNLRAYAFTFGGCLK